MNHEQDCIILLEYLVKHGQKSLRVMEKDTGIPFSTIREYIKPKVLAFRTWPQILKMREHTRTYSFYVTTLEKPNNKGAYINISKFIYLQHYGMQFGYYVYYSEERKRTYVIKIEEEKLWELV